MYHVMEIGNLTYRDESRVKDYLITRTGRGHFNLPLNLNGYTFMYPGTRKDLICQSTLDESKGYTYTRDMMNAKLEKFEDEMNELIEDFIRTNGDVSPYPHGDKVNVFVVDLNNPMIVHEGSE